MAAVSSNRLLITLICAGEGRGGCMGEEERVSVTVSEREKQVTAIGIASSSARDTLQLGTR